MMTIFRGFVAGDAGGSSRRSHYSLPSLSPQIKDMVLELTLSLEFIRFTCFRSVERKCCQLSKCAIEGIVEQELFRRNFEGAIGEPWQYTLGHEETHTHVQIRI